MGGSLGVAVRKAVLDGFRTHLAGLPAFNSTAVENEVEVLYAWDFKRQTRQRVYGGRSAGTTPPAAMRAGRNHRNETATFQVNIRVEIPNATQEEADERLDEIAVQFEEWVADRKSNELGAGTTSLKVTSWAGDYFAVDSGAGSIRTYTVSWSARLT